MGEVVNRIEEADEQVGWKREVNEREKDRVRYPEETGKLEVT